MPAPVTFYTPRAYHGLQNKHLMRTIYALLPTLLLSATLMAQDVYYDNNAVKRDVTAFHGLDVSTGIEVIIEHGDNEGLAVSAPDAKALENLKTEVSNGILKIYYSTELHNLYIPKNWKLKAYVSYKTLDLIKASSGASIKGGLWAGQMKVRANSGAVVSLRGAVDSLEVRSSSGAQFKGYDMVANYLQADAESGGSIQAVVNKEVNAEASSGGYINYKGEAVVRNVNVNSGGSVRKAQ